MWCTTIMDERFCMFLPFLFSPPTDHKLLSCRQIRSERQSRKVLFMSTARNNDSSHCGASARSIKCKPEQEQKRRISDNDRSLFHHTSFHLMLSKSVFPWVRIRIYGNNQVLNKCSLQCTSELTSLSCCVLKHLKEKKELTAPLIRYSLTC